MNVYGETAKGAVLSPDEVYRSALWRRWDLSRQGLIFCDENDDLLSPPLVFDMLNPSIADAEDDDATVVRCCSYAKHQGAGGTVIVNMHDWRATDPAAMIGAQKVGRAIVSPDNLAAVRAAFELARPRGYVIAAWGSTKVPGIADRIADHIQIARDVGVEFRAMLTTEAGDPCHPLVRRKVHPQPQPWSPPCHSS